jgi:hypothetical protein
VRATWQPRGDEGAEVRDCITTYLYIWALRSNVRAASVCIGQQEEEYGIADLTLALFTVREEISVIVKVPDGVVLGAARRLFGACCPVLVLIRRQVAESLIAGLCRACPVGLSTGEAFPGIRAPRFIISARAPVPMWSNQTIPHFWIWTLDRQGGVAGRQHGRFRILGPHLAWSGHGEPGALAGGD